jgi:hypothetical protein
MKHLATSLTLCGLLAVVSSVPANATLITFSTAPNNNAGGDLTTATTPSLPNPTATILGISSLGLTTLAVSGAPSNSGTYTPIFVTESYNGTTDLLTITGTINGCPTCGNLPGLTSSSTLLSIQFAGNLTANATTSSASLNNPPPPGITSITVNATLLADLGLTGANFFFSNLSGTGNSNGDPGNYNLSTESLTISTTTPEPATWLLMLCGLGLVVALRKVSIAAKKRQIPAARPDHKLSVPHVWIEELSSR